MDSCIDLCGTGLARFQARRNDLQYLLTSHRSGKGKWRILKNFQNAPMVTVRPFEVNPELKILIASGYSEDGPVRKSVKTGAKSFIGKPYRVSEMLRAIRDTLDDG